MQADPSAVKAPNKREQRLAQIKARRPNPQPDLLDALDTSAPSPAKAKSAAKPKKAAAPKLPATRGKLPVQRDFLSAIFDVTGRDNRHIMDVAIFRLSKRGQRANDTIRYDLPNGYVEVSAGSNGMATVWDYDLVLMAVSNITEAMNRYRAGKGPFPSRTFRPHVGDVLKFCRKENGGTQRDSILASLKRLSTTLVMIQREVTVNGVEKVIDSGETLIGSFGTVANGKTKKLEYLEYTIPQWMFDQITTTATPEVLSVHQDYFLLESGMARFIYRVARLSAGSTHATWGFDLIRERSGSVGPQKEVNRMLRELIASNDLPEYDLAEVQGKNGPMLSMVYRDSLKHLKS